MRRDINLCSIVVDNAEEISSASLFIRFGMGLSTEMGIWWTDVGFIEPVCVK